MVQGIASPKTVLVLLFFPSKVNYLYNNRDKVNR